jgi:SRSO17 transposase
VVRLEYENDIEQTADIWGLPLAEVRSLGERLQRFWKRFSPLVRTQTRDTSVYGLDYLSGMLRIDDGRNMAGMSQKLGISSQNLQHFISNSPWPARAMIEAVQREVAQRPEFQQEAGLIIDESADEKSGTVSAGAGRQYNGRTGTVDECQVGVFMTLATPQANLWVDGDLFIPKGWFDKEATARRERVGIPAERVFQTKPQLAWEMIIRAQQQGIPFRSVSMDTLYGRNQELRHKIQDAQIEYYADVPVNTRVYLCPPQLIYAITKRGKRAAHPHIIGAAYEVCALLDSPALRWETITVRPNERGFLTADFTRLRVWTIHEKHAHEEWLLIRQDADQLTFTLSNASAHTSLATMAYRRSLRYFVERSNQDNKSELGWDEFQAIKFQAWEHHLALTILASWFLAETRLDWAVQFQRSPALLAQYETDVLPSLSVANIRTLLLAAMPLPQLSVEDAVQLVVGHLDNRTRSRKSRLRGRPAT